MLRLKYMNSPFFHSLLILCSFAWTLHAKAGGTTMTMNHLRTQAFASCQSVYNKPVIEPVPMLDPPATGNPWDIGLVYQEELAITSPKILDQHNFYFLAKPRAALNNLGMDIYISDDGGATFQLKSWEDANVDYSSKSIQPSIDKNAIPPAGRVLTEMIIGHASPHGGYPQLFNIRSSAYLRFSGYKQIQGASLRLAAHRIFGESLPENSAGEDFPVVRKVFGYARNSHTSTFLLLVENGLFCGALQVDMNEGDDANMVIDSYWYTRENFAWQASPHTALVAYSSMLWKTELDTPEILTDEAHDSDSLKVYYRDHKSVHHQLIPPPEGIRVTSYEDYGLHGWSLNNEDQDPYHYLDFASALGETNYDKRASYAVEILASNVKTAVTSYEQATQFEYADNIVAASTLRQDISKSTTARDYIHFKYKTTSYYPPSPYVMPR